MFTQLTFKVGRINFASIDPSPHSLLTKPELFENLGLTFTVVNLGLTFPRLRQFGVIN